MAHLVVEIGHRKVSFYIRKFSGDTEIDDETLVSLAEIPFIICFCEEIVGSWLHLIIFTGTSKIHFSVVFHGNIVNQPNKFINSYLKIK